MAVCLCQVIIMLNRSRLLVVDTRYQTLLGSSDMTNDTVESTSPRITIISHIQCQTLRPIKHHGQPITHRFQYAKYIQIHRQNIPDAIKYIFP